VLEFINANNLATFVRMLRSTFAGSFLLVEGDTDARLFGRLTDRTKCQVINSYNRDNVINIVSILDKGNFTGHVGLIDNDFADCLGQDTKSDNILVADENDLESMIFMSDVFERFVIEYCSKDKIIAFENKHSGLIRNRLIENGSLLGTIRFLSKKLGWQLDFEGMTVKYVERRDITVDLDKQIEHLRGRSQGTTMPTTSEVKEAITGAQREHPRLAMYACGHDLCELISKGVHDVFGRAHHMLARGFIAVEEVFRTSYTLENFKSSGLYQRMKAWEIIRQPFRLLAD
jgi:hypothetical protein